MENYWIVSGNIRYVSLLNNVYVLGLHRPYSTNKDILNIIVEQNLASQLKIGEDVTLVGDFINNKDGFWQPRVKKIAHDKL